MVINVSTNLVWAKKELICPHLKPEYLRNIHKTKKLQFESHTWYLEEYFRPHYDYYGSYKMMYIFIEDVEKAISLAFDRKISDHVCQYKAVIPPDNYSALLMFSLIGEQR